MVLPAAPFMPDSQVLANPETSLKFTEGACRAGYYLAQPANNHNRLPHQFINSRPATHCMKLSIYHPGFAIECRALTNFIPSCHWLWRRCGTSQQFGTLIALKMGIRGFLLSYRRPKFISLFRPPKLQLVFSLSRNRGANAFSMDVNHRFYSEGSKEFQKCCTRQAIYCSANF